MNSIPSGIPARRLLRQRWISLCFAGLAVISARAAEPLGLFEGHGDIGQAGKAGAVEFDSGNQSYILAGGGENMWFRADALHFVWKRMAGDVSLAADVRWVGSGGNAHRKACLIIRQSLEADSAYADAVVHGDGLTSLQYREAAGEVTREIQSNLSRPTRLRLEKRGEFVSMSLAREGESLQPAGGSFKIQFKEPFYVGLGVCAHDNQVLEKAIFSRVEIVSLAARASAGDTLESTLETVAIASKDRRVVHHSRQPIAGPNWSRDGKFFLFNREGRIFRLDREGGEPQAVEIAWADRCQLNHAISPDGTQFVVSYPATSAQSQIYQVPISGGAPRRLTPLGPARGHGWSPDGQTLVFAGERNGQVDLYAIGASGGDERRLTTGFGPVDGAEYSADGRHVYFASPRTGLMKLWRVKADGTEPMQLTSDEFNDWHPHPSPDGKWIAFLSCARQVQGRPLNQDVQIRMMPSEGGEIQVVAKLLGGDGTFNSPSWSPDSRHLAFVSYRPVTP